MDASAILEGAGDLAMTHGPRLLTAIGIMIVPVAALFCAMTVLALPAIAVEKPSPISGDVEFGYLASEGNTDAKTLTGRGTLVWEEDQWKNDSNVEALNSESGGVRSAEKYFFSNRLAYTFSPYNYWFNYISYEDDRFSGFKYKGTIVFGYGRRLIENNKMLWDAEIGPGYRRSEVAADSEGDDQEEGIVRVSSSYKWKLSETATFEQKLSVEAGDENTISKSTTSLKTSVVADIGLNIAYVVNYTEEVPDDKVHADKQTTVTLVYTF